MKIKSLKISNALSFKYYSDINEVPEIYFEQNRGNEVNILIGPNGAGKSNFIEIIGKLFNNSIFKHIVFDENLVRSDQINVKPLRLFKSNSNPPSIYILKNWNSLDKEQKIVLTLTLNENDYKNLEFIISHLEKIKDYILRYADTGFTLNFKFNEDIADLINKIYSIKQISLIFTRADDAKPFNIFVDESQEFNNLVKWYLEYFYLIQNVINLHNQLKGNENSIWRNLKNTFAFINCFRNYDDIPLSHSAIDNRANQLTAELEKTAKVSALGKVNTQQGFFLSILYELSKQAYELGNNIGASQIPEILYKTDLYLSLNTLIKKFLNLELKLIFQRARWTVSFNFLDEDRSYNFVQLSSGQKAIIHLIFSLYGYDIKHGMMIIDEPELHLHPQLQKQYLEIIEQESNNRDIQFLLITHSPVFVTENTIANVKRVYFSNHTSNVFIPKEISLDDSLLIRILSYTNNSKIFFVNKVILVEGAGDEYFLNYYISKVFPLAENFEILNIGGKEEFPKWKEFLEKWGLQVYFIGDWDNVKNFDILSEAEYQNFKNRSGQQNIKKISKTLYENNYRDGKSLLELVELVIEDSSCLSTIQNDLIQAFNKVIDKHISCSDILKYLKNSNIDSFQAINKKIEEKYQDKVFILKHGELEDYLNLSKNNKGLKQVVEFCNQDNLDLIEVECKQELDTILSNILIKD